MSLTFQSIRRWAGFGAVASLTLVGILMALQWVELRVGIPYFDATTGTTYLAFFLGAPTSFLIEWLISPLWPIPPDRFIWAYLFVNWVLIGALIGFVLARRAPRHRDAAA